MTLPSSGTLSLNQIHVEAGGSSGSQCSLNDSDIRGLINKSSGSQMAFTEWYGASAETVLGSNVAQITVSNYISSGGTFRIPSNRWVYSNSTSTPALTIDIPCTVINEGKIIGCGAVGGRYYIAATAGGPAINVTSSGVTITNSSGAFIAGGGGGGAHGRDHSNPNDYNSGGGGGAGGGAGGLGGSGYANGGTGGGINSAGSRGYNKYNSQQIGGYGGGSGGGGGYKGSNVGGGGGGRILPGVGGNSNANNTALKGGSAGSAGTNSGVHEGGGGGGGWGASGGSGNRGDAGGSGGAAITGTSRTLSNSGTIYGST